MRGKRLAGCRRNALLENIATLEADMIKVKQNRRVGKGQTK